MTKTQFIKYLQSLNLNYFGVTVKVYTNSVGVNLQLEKYDYWTNKCIRYLHIFTKKEFTKEIALLEVEEALMCITRLQFREYVKSETD